MGIFDELLSGDHELAQALRYSLREDYEDEDLAEDSDLPDDESPVRDEELDDFVSILSEFGY